MAKNTKKGLDFSALGGLVYSTEKGRTCPSCEQSIDECACDNDSIITGSGNVTLWYETKGRKGKGVTLVRELAMNNSDLTLLAKKMKNHCGTGGSVKNGTIEIQGDQRERIQQFLLKMDINSKFAGR